MAGIDIQLSTSSYFDIQPELFSGYKILVQATQVTHNDYILAQ